MKSLLKAKIFTIKGITITLGKVSGILLVLVITRIILFIVRKLLANASKKRQNDPRYITIYKFISYFAWILVIAIGFDIVGFKFTLLLASSAALFVGIGLGIQDVFKDFVSGFVIFFEGALKPGDVVEVDGLISKVKEINLRTTTVMTNNDIVLIIPNRIFTNNKVINWSHSKEVTRFSITVGVAFDSDPELVRKILIDCALEHPEVVKEHKQYQPFTRLAHFGDYRLEFELMFWCRKAFQIDNTKSQIRYLILQKFRENKVHIPYPQNDIFIRSKRMEGDVG